MLGSYRNRGTEFELDRKSEVGAELEGLCALTKLVNTLIDGVPNDILNCERRTKTGLS